MSVSEIPLPPGELERLAECVLEPIRFPGSVQPHGLLLVVDETTFEIREASENARDIVGADAIALLGRPLTDLLGTASIAQIQAVLDGDSETANPIRMRVGDALFDVITHSAGEGELFVELEPIEADLDDRVAAIRVAFRRLTDATSVEELWATTASELRRITGFDRVMVYHFHEDGHGEVVGEAVADDMEPYLGLHYPASDIPAQARQLYITKLSRQIVNSSAQPAAILSDANVPGRAPRDLSNAELRAVSPHHLQFMRNMGQASTFSLSMVRGGEFVGMITCAHRTERRVAYGTREALELLANQTTLQLGAMMDVERLNRDNVARSIRATLLQQVAEDQDIETGLLTHETTLLDLVPANGAYLQLGDVASSIGTVPAGADRLGELLDIAEPFSSNSLPSTHPELALALPDVTGLLVVPLSGEGDFIAWFRGELAQTVNWLGDMSLSNRVSTLSPRNSFSAWTEEVTGTALPWREQETDAAELSRDLGFYLLRRAESRLAQQALVDPLTGLPNRRLLMDRLEQALTRRSRTGNIALLFIDVDHFKAINDTYGHAAGDAALVHVAQSLTAAARQEDTVARLGGDEFVVFCENIDLVHAEAIAARLLEHITAVPPGGVPWRVTASVGIAMADDASAASAVLSAADAAMYEAKVAKRG